jgi:hypothetical protein
MPFGIIHGRFGIVCGHLEYFYRFGSLDREKSGNPDCHFKHFVPMDKSYTFNNWRPRLYFYRQHRTRVHFFLASFSYLPRFTIERPPPSRTDIAMAIKKISLLCSEQYIHNRIKLQLKNIFESINNFTVSQFSSLAQPQSCLLTGKGNVGPTYSHKIF